MLVFWFGRRVLLTLAVVLALVSGLVIVRSGLAAGVAGAVVTIDNFAFGPGTITVKRGTTVTWLNKDDEPHTVVNDGDPRVFKSKALDTDDSYAFTFDKAGTYRYFCSVHPQMQGRVVVE
jgi:plastocyanin